MKKKYLYPFSASSESKKKMILLPPLSPRGCDEDKLDMKVPDFAYNDDGTIRENTETVGINALMKVIEVYIHYIYCIY